ncbi:aminomethyltransferase family protein [Atopobium fossor]|uniref:aminomethyltransferase family protein n=1 Tax=Atopobium fossor TaxID=39487 RepID=UPI0003FC3B91|nr:aminomethyltransferase family protein [Atopobium fossor]
MSSHSSQVDLLKEHMLLGGVMAQRHRAQVALHYHSASNEKTAVLESCALTHLADLGMMLVSGTDALGLIQAAVACTLPDVGSFAYGAVLSGDGALLGVPMVVRTGDTEFLLLDNSSRFELLYEWISWLSQVEQQGVAPYENTSVSNESTALVPFQLTGPQASSILNDYLTQHATLPKQGGVANLTLDSTMSIVLHDGIAGQDSFIVLVPPAVSVVFWRSFLSFSEVEPVGHDVLDTFVRKEHPWTSALSHSDRVSVTRTMLSNWNICRSADDFIGARALSH